MRHMCVCPEKLGKCLMSLCLSLLLAFRRAEAVSCAAVMANRQSTSTSSATATHTHLPTLTTTATALPYAHLDTPAVHTNIVCHVVKKRGC